MSHEKHIIIADTSLFRTEEMDRLARSLMPAYPLTLHTFDASVESRRDVVVAQVVVKINNLLDTHPDIVLVTNCALGVKHDLIGTVRRLEEGIDTSIRKVLLTCKRGHEVRYGFQQRGLSLDGIEHVVWNALPSSLHRDRMSSIFQGNPPEENPL